jgi:hypothetical protein
MTVVVTEAGDPTPAAEQAAPAEMADAAVAIAEIQADRDVAIAEIQAETTETAIEADAAANDEDVEWLRAELAGLHQRCATQEAALSSLETTLVALSAQVGEMASGLAILLASQMPPTLSEPPTAEPEPTPPEQALASEAAGSRASDAEPETPASEAARRRMRWL